MNIVFIDRHGDMQSITGFDCLSDDDEWLTMVFGQEKKALHKSNLFDRTYVVYTEMKP
jgi:hypothetical protein